MKIYITLLWALTLLASGCSTVKQDESEAAVIISNDNATGPYLTHNRKGEVVLCWMAKESPDSVYRIKYAVFDSVSNQFGKTVTVNTSAGASYSAESMAKVAFKNDGTAIAFFSKKFENERNPYAGGIFYSMSADEGKSWTNAQFLHSDTSHEYGRNFFDVAALKDGEIAAIWLDGRFGKAQKGSALFFAKTERGKGFGADSCLSKGTCECCRTDLLSDDTGNLHIAYRSIQFPSALMGAQVRDMVYITSQNNGKSFSGEKTISADNWKIDGCPHSGPSLAMQGQTLNSVWFTAAAGNTGLYFAQQRAGSEFSKRNLISTGGRHPQLASINGKLLLVFEEAVSSPTEHHNHSMQKGHQHQPAMAASIKLVKINGKELSPIAVTDGSAANHHAVITNINNKQALIAWIREENNQSFICYSIKNVTDD